MGSILVTGEDDPCIKHREELGNNTASFANARFRDSTLVTLAEGEAVESRAGRLLGQVW